jgi:hypothetical protein
LTASRAIVTGNKSNKENTDMFSLFMAVLVMAGSYSVTNTNTYQVGAPSPLAVSNVNDVPPPAPPETVITVSGVE